MLLFLSLDRSFAKLHDFFLGFDLKALFYEINYFLVGRKRHRFGLQIKELQTPFQYYSPTLSSRPSRLASASMA